MTIATDNALVARALSAPARLMLLEQIAQGERGVEALADKTGLTTANASQHLQQLRCAGLVTSRRSGKLVLYRLRDAKTLALMDLIRVVAERSLAQVERLLRGLSDGADAIEPITRGELAARITEGSDTVFDLRPWMNMRWVTSHMRGMSRSSVLTALRRCSTRVPRMPPIAAVPTVFTPIRPSPHCACGG